MASSPVKDLSREHTHQKQQSPYDGEGLSSKFLPKPSIIARAYTTPMAVYGWIT